MSAWASWDRRQRMFAIAVAAVAVASVLYALILKFEPFGDRTVITIDDVGEALAAATAAAACAWAARRSTGNNRLGWALMGVSTGLWAAGQVTWTIYEVVLQQQVPQPGLVDIGFLSAVPFAVAGIRAFWGDAQGTSSRWRVWFDGVIVAIALTCTAWAFGLREVYNSSSSTKLLDLAYPVTDIVVGTVLILAIRRAAHQQAGRMAFLLAGIACYSIADSAFAYLNAHGPGTAQCDAAEAEMLDTLLTDAEVYSLKPMVGHCQGAASAVELAATCMARSRTRFWKASVFATKSVSQLTSISTPSLEPAWM